MFSKLLKFSKLQKILKLQLLFWMKLIAIVFLCSANNNYSKHILRLSIYNRLTQGYSLAICLFAAISWTLIFNAQFGSWYRWLFWSKRSSLFILKKASCIIVCVVAPKYEFPIAQPWHQISTLKFVIARLAWLNKNSKIHYMKYPVGLW